MGHQSIKPPGFARGQNNDHALTLPTQFLVFCFVHTSIIRCHTSPSDLCLMAVRGTFEGTGSTAPTAPPRTFGSGTLQLHTLRVLSPKWRSSGRSSHRWPAHGSRRTPCRWGRCTQPVKKKLRNERLTQAVSVRTNFPVRTSGRGPS